MLGWTRVCFYGFFALGSSTQYLIDPDLGFWVVIVVFGMLGMEILTHAYRSINGFRLGLVAPLKEECDDLAAQDEVLGHASLGMLISLPCFASAGLIVLSIEGFFSHTQASGPLLNIGFGLIIAGLLVGVMLSELVLRRGWKAMRYRTVSRLGSGQVDPD